MTEKKQCEEEKIKVFSIIMIIMAILMVCGAITFFIISGNISRNIKDYIEVKAEVVDFKKYEHDNFLGLFSILTEQVLTEFEQNPYYESLSNGKQFLG